jgi:hypothetical protein
MLFCHSQTKAQGLKTGNGRIAALSCSSIFLHHYNTVIVKNNVLNETLVLKKHVGVGAFTKLCYEGIVICILKGR